MSWERLEQKEKERNNTLYSYIERKPERLEQFKKILGGFSIEKLRMTCETDRDLSRDLEEAVGHATAYAEKLVRMEEIENNTARTSADEAEFSKLVGEQSADKDLFISSLGNLYGEIKEKNLDSSQLDPLFGKSSTFNSQLALYVAFSSLR